MSTPPPHPHTVSFTVERPGWPFAVPRPPWWGPGLGPPVAKGAAGAPSEAERDRYAGDMEEPRPREGPSTRALLSSQPLPFLSPAPIRCCFSPFPPLQTPTHASAPVTHGRLGMRAPRGQKHRGARQTSWLPLCLPGDSRNVTDCPPLPLKWHKKLKCSRGPQVTGKGREGPQGRAPPTAKSPRPRASAPPGRTMVTPHTAHLLRPQDPTATLSIHPKEVKTASTPNPGFVKPPGICRPAGCPSGWAPIGGTQVASRPEVEAGGW